MRRRRITILGVAIGTGVGAVLAFEFGAEYLAIGVGAGLAIGSSVDAKISNRDNDDEDSRP